MTIIGGIVLAAPAGDAAQLTDLEGIFQNALGAALGLGGILLFFMILAGGFQYMTSAGDPKKLEGAQHTLTYAIVGMVLVAAAYLILVIINEITGADVINFSISG